MRPGSLPEVKAGRSMTGPRVGRADARPLHVALIGHSSAGGQCGDVGDGGGGFAAGRSRLRTSWVVAVVVLTVAVTVLSVLIAIRWPPLVRLDADVALEPAAVMPAVLGVHYPSDAAGGLIVGVLCAVALMPLLGRAVAVRPGPALLLAP